MKNEKLIAQIQELGLSEHEAKIYLFALSLGPTTVLKISKVTDIKRSTVYAVINELIHKGFLHIESRGFKRVFVAEDPRSLERNLEVRKERFREALPDLLELHNRRGGGSVIKYYEGVKAVRGVYEDFLKDFKPHDDYFAVANMEKWLGQDEGYFMKWRTKRSKLNLNTRMIFENNETGRKLKEFAPNFFEKVKLLPEGHHLETSLLVTPRRAIIQQYNEPVSVLVNENPSNILLYKEMFEIMWNALSD